MVAAAAWANPKWRRVEATFASIDVVSASLALVDDEELSRGGRATKLVALTTACDGKIGPASWRFGAGDVLVGLNGRSLRRVTTNEEFKTEILERLTAAGDPSRVVVAIAPRNETPYPVAWRAVADDAPAVDVVFSGRELGFSLSLARNRRLDLYFVVVRSVRKASPLSAAGVKPGVVLRAVDGEALDLDAAIRGKPAEAPDDVWRAILNTIRLRPRPLVLTFGGLPPKGRPSAVARALALVHEKEHDVDHHLYERAFHRQRLGLGLAVSKRELRGTPMIQVASLDDDCEHDDIHLGDVLVAVDGIQDQCTRISSLREALEARSRPVSLRFETPDPRALGLELPQAIDLFDAIDRRGTGHATRHDFIEALRANIHLATTLGLPQYIVEQDGSRAQFDGVFRDLDTNGDSLVSADEWAAGIRARSGFVVV
ncbi:hypothetical protein CTAYLR_003930 [Chrysophaeum taylorii]|uniref:EF-hand domain-containing protein n=1 Tax=Chrysophaeum taylorii TaxID=2483200 RepID=A0AAD7U9H2_9STRA|nr:hypothetical protein CTAYLR_003930 [Chrysophaeum taylorii]